MKIIIKKTTTNIVVIMQRTNQFIGNFGKIRHLTKLVDKTAECY